MVCTEERFLDCKAATSVYDKTSCCSALLLFPARAAQTVHTTVTVPLVLFVVLTLYRQSSDDKSDTYSDVKRVFKHSKVSPCKPWSISCLITVEDGLFVGFRASPPRFPFKAFSSLLATFFCDLVGLNSVVCNRIVNAGQQLFQLSGL